MNTMATARKTASNAQSDDKLDGVVFDDELTLNLDEIEDTNSGPRPHLPAGTYEVEVVESEFTKSKKDRPQVHTTFSTIHDDQDKNRQWVHYYTVLDSKVGQSRFKELVKILLGDEAASQIVVRDVVDELVGKRCRVRVGVEPNPNNPERKTNPVKSVMPSREAGDDWLSEN